MDKNKLIEQLIKEKGGTREQYLSLLNQIAYHESAHTLDPKIKQIGGGPGRGKYQFEEGKDQGGITAARRTKKYLDSLGEETPKWLQEALKGDSLDATKLNSDQQDILFLGNMRMHPKADIGKVVNGKQTISDFWANFHWAGSDKDRDARLKSFNNSVADFKKKSQPWEGSSQVKEEVAEDNARPIVNQAVRDNIPQPQQQQVEPTIREPHQWETLGRQEIKGVKEDSPLFSDVSTSMYDFIKQRKTQQNKGELAQFNGGGTHEQNPNGGIPQGMGANGKPNTVEEGETAYTFGEDKFVFTDRYGLDGFKPKAGQALSMNAFALGGFADNNDPPTKNDPRYLTKTQDNTNTQLYIQPKEAIVNDYYQQQKEQKELHTTGTIVNPTSQRYMSRINPSQPDIKQDNMNPEQRERDKVAMDKALTLERGLIYLDNPFKIAGDVGNVLGIDNNLPNSEEDKLRINRSRNFTNESALDRAEPHIAGAVINTAFGAATTPGKFLSVGNVINEAINPLANVGLLDDAFSAARVVGAGFIDDAAKLGKAVQNLPYKDIARNAKSVVTGNTSKLNKMLRKSWDQRKMFEWNSEMAHDAYQDGAMNLPIVQKANNRQFNYTLNNYPDGYESVDRNYRALIAHKGESKGITRVDKETLTYGRTSGLTHATEQGTKKIVDFNTGKEIEASVKITPSGGNTLKLENTGVKKYTNEASTNIEVNPEYVETVKGNIEWAEKSIPGFRVYGSAKGVTEGGLPHLTGDIDGYITQANYEKHVKNKFPFVRENGITEPARIHNINKAAGQGGDVDFNIIPHNSKGLVDGTSWKARELYRQVDPEGYYKEAKRLVQDSDLITMADDKLGVEDAINKAGGFKIPHTPDELLAKLDELDPTVKTIMDAYESPKNKHINRIDSYIHYGNTEKVAKAQEQYVKSVAGPDANLGHQFTKEELSDVARNKSLLHSIKHSGDPEAIANSPERMQIVLNDYYINNTVLSRATSLRRYEQGAYKDNADALQQIDESFKLWRPGTVSRGGSANGAGQNHVKLGDSQWGGDFYSHKQVGANLDTSSPEAYVADMRSKYHNHDLKDEEIQKVSELYDKYGLPQKKPSTTMDRIISEVSTNVPEANQLLGEIAKTLGIRASTSNNRFGNSIYISTLDDFDDALDKLVYGYKEHIVKPKSLLERREEIIIKNPSTSMGDIITTESQFKKIESLLDGGIEKAEKRYQERKALENKLRAEAIKFHNKVIDKAQKAYEKDNPLMKQAERADKRARELFEYRAKLEKVKRRIETTRIILFGGGGITALGGTLAYGFNEFTKPGKQYKARMAAVEALPPDQRKEYDSLETELRYLRTGLRGIPGPDRDEREDYRELISKDAKYKELSDKIATTPAEKEPVVSMRLQLERDLRAQEIVKQLRQKNEK